MPSRYLVGVVGVDGSDGGRRALDWAVRENILRTSFRTMLIEPS